MTRIFIKVLTFVALGATLVAEPVIAQKTDTTMATDALSEFESACGRVEQLWAAPLCGPIVLVDPATRVAVTNRPDPEGTFKTRETVWVGRLPAKMPVANAGIEWGGERWAMVMLPLSSDRFDRLRLLAHESFHRIQPALGFEPSNPMATHLDEESARIWLRLELRALAKAMEVGGKKATHAVSDALLFRAVRHRAFPDAAAVEARLEWHEGLAEYTGVRFAIEATDESPKQAAALAARFEDRPTYVRSLGYGTGPLLGLLLDRYDPGWRQRPEPHDLAARLGDAVAEMAAVPDASDTDVAWSRAASYDVETLRSEESERAARIAELRQKYRQELVDGPVLHLELPDKQLMFNPNTVLALGDQGNVYPGAILVGPWGRLTLHEGAALGSHDRGRARVAAPRILEPGPEGKVHGPEWTLELESGWRLIPGERNGDVRLEQKR